MWLHATLSSVNQSFVSHHGLLTFLWSLTSFFILLANGGVSAVAWRHPLAAVNTTAAELGHQAPVVRPRPPPTTTRLPFRQVREVTCAGVCLQTKYHTSFVPLLPGSWHLTSTSIYAVSRRIADNPAVFSVPTIIRPLLSDNAANRLQLVQDDRDSRQFVRHTVGLRRTPTLHTQFNVGIFNARSVHNKSSSIADWISSLL